MESTKPLISIVIPSYNDAPIIIPFHTAIVETMESCEDFGFELIYVDDGSSDNSPEILNQIQKEDSRVTFIEFWRNFGQQRALFAGCKASKGDYVVTLDGDYQYDPEVILQLVRAMGQEYHLASGIRRQRKDNLLDKLYSVAGNFCINKILKVNIQDFGSVKAFSRQLVKNIILLEHYYSDVYPTALSLHPKMIEVPVNHKPRPVGKSHWNIWKRLKIYFDLYISYGDEHFELPFRLGLLNALAAVGLGSLAFLYKATLGHQASYFELGTLIFIIFMLGFFLIAWSLTMSFLVKIYKQNVRKDPYLLRELSGSDRDKDI